MINVKPILFSSGMVKAILREIKEPGTGKTQTRRIIKPQPGHKVTSAGVVSRSGVGQTDEWHWLSGDPKDCDTWGSEGDFGTGYRPGYLLWLREACGTGGHFPSPWAYRADGKEYKGERWTPSIFMPRRASRLTLEVTDVRVQRLQEITEADAKAEGVERLDPTPEDEEWNRRWCEEEARPVEPLHPVWTAPGTRQGYGPRKDDPQWGPTPEFAFRLLWDSINATRGFGWDTNPWIVALTFQPHLANVDDLLRGGPSA